MARGLHPVQLVISDAHTGLKPPSPPPCREGSWQRRIHVGRTLRWARRGSFRPRSVSSADGLGDGPPQRCPVDQRGRRCALSSPGADRCLQCGR
jgi:hypothetical protein